MSIISLPPPVKMAKTINRIPTPEYTREHWGTESEINFAKEMFKKKKLHLYKKAIQLRDIWDDGNFLSIDKDLLMDAIERMERNP